MDLEFTISQYADGTLDDAGRVALEERLAQDPEARELLAQHRKLDDLLDQMPPVPEMKWDLLAERISAAVAAQDAPAQSYRIFWRRPLLPLAVAASLLVAAGIGVRVYVSSSQGPGQSAHAPVVVAEVSGPRAESSAGPIAQVSIGPAKALAGDSAAANYSDDLISRPARVIIASGVNPAQDTLALPY